MSRRKDPNAEETIVLGNQIDFYSLLLYMGGMEIKIAISIIPFKRLLISLLLQTMTELKQVLTSLHH